MAYVVEQRCLCGSRTVLRFASWLALTWRVNQWLSDWQSEHRRECVDMWVPVNRPTVVRVA